MKRNGFTILEILVVLAVLAILIGIAVPRIKGMQEQVNITKAKGELRTIQTALETYYMNQTPNSYPESTDDSVIFHLTENVLILQRPQIVPGIMIDPFGLTSTSEYFYRRSDNGKYYMIGSIGMNKVISSEAQIKAVFRIDDNGAFSDQALLAIDGGAICVSNAVSYE